MSETETTQSLLGRIAEKIDSLKESMTEFKATHRLDVDLLHELREKENMKILAMIAAIDLRLKETENHNVRRQGGLMSARTLIEIIVGFITLYFYYRMAKG